MTARWWAEQAWLGGDAVERGIVIEVDGGLITAVDRGEAPPGTPQLAGLTIPGLVNAHSHAFHRALRGRHQGRGDFWSWREGMYRLAATLDPDLYLDLATAVYGEMALAGITTVGEFHYLHHDRGGASYADPNEMGRALIEAATAAGLRLTLLDTLYLRSGFGDEQLSPAQLRFSDGSIDRWIERVGLIGDDDRLRVGAAAHSVRAVGSDDLAVLGSWATTLDRPLHVHAAEQTTEDIDCRAATGRSPVGVLADAGFLGPGTTVVHATHAAAHDIELVGASKTTVCLCPTTERDLGDGIGPAAALVVAGAPLCLGSDSHAVIDLFEEARAVELDERLAARARGLLSTSALLTAATSAGARSVGWPSNGLAVGDPADFVTIDLNSTRTAGVDDPLAAAIYAASSAEVRHVVVGGHAVVVDGQHVALGDVAARLSRAINALWTAAAR